MVRKPKSEAPSVGQQWVQGCLQVCRRRSGSRTKSSAVISCGSPISVTLENTWWAVRRLHPERSPSWSQLVEMNLQGIAVGADGGADLVEVQSHAFLSQCHLSRRWLGKMMMMPRPGPAWMCFLFCCGSLPAPLSQPCRSAVQGTGAAELHQVVRTRPSSISLRYQCS